MPPLTKQAFIINTLQNLYPTVSPPLQFSSHYTLLVSVLLSAQCTDERVNTVTPHLFALADTPQKMCNVTVLQIQSIIRPCGLAPRKAAAIHELSCILVEKYAGEVPNSFEALEALPGVGHKTASVVMSQGFGVAAFPVDTHIHRLAERWGLSSGKNVVQTERDLKAFFPENLWNKLHLQIIFYGRQYCKARGHVQQNCLICNEIQKNNW